MAWPVIALAIGGSAFAARAGFRCLKKANVDFRKVGLPSWVAPGIDGLRNLSRDLRGFDNPISASEAYQILNISPAASKEKILQAHKQLMLRNHPDNGGSTYVAAKVNEAKDFLLK